MDNFTYAVTNETPENGEVKKFPLEKSMRHIGAEEGAFVLGVLDCCREKITEKITLQKRVFIKGGTTDLNEELEM